MAPPEPLAPSHSGAVREASSPPFPDVVPGEPGSRRSVQPALLPRTASGVTAPVAGLCSALTEAALLTAAQTDHLTPRPVDSQPTNISLSLIKRTFGLVCKDLGIAVPSTFSELELLSISVIGIFLGCLSDCGCGTMGDTMVSEREMLRLLCQLVF